MNNLLRPSVVVGFCGLATLLPAQPQSKFEVSFPASVHTAPITGRVFVAISKKESPAPMLQAGSWGGQAPLFAVDQNLKPIFAFPGYALAASTAMRCMFSISP